MNKRKMIAGDKEELRRIGRELAAYMIASGIEAGELNTKGKQGAELEQEFTRFLRARTKKDTRYAVQIDHSLDLLSRARDAREANRFELASLFYATWVEHWSNWVVRCYVLRSGLGERQAIEIIRSVQIRGKLTWLLSLVGAREIPKHHVNAVQAIVDARNSFVHYKWVGVDLDRSAETEVEIKRKIAEAEAAIAYLQRYRNRWLLDGKTSAIHKMVGGRKRRKK